LFSPTNQFLWHISHSRATKFNAMPKSATQPEVHLDFQGRLVIPVPLRRSLRFAAGEHLIARIEDGRLVLEKAGTIKQRLKSRFAWLPLATSLAEELITEQREAAKREANE
jgi:bifunctional DNA-binding transcriptional regulator/antitoxin component of YhaV-PrlF toxin-antitoxin module